MRAATARMTRDHDHHVVMFDLNQIPRKLAKASVTRRYEATTRNVHCMEIEPTEVSITQADHHS